MSDSHKKALAEGREIGRAVRLYLEALDAHQPRRGRRRTADSIQARLSKLDDQIATADPMGRVALIQERIDLQNELGELTDTVDLAETEKAFVSVAQRYSELKGIRYAAWREVGVPPSVLKAAGVRRSA